MTISSQRFKFLDKETNIGTLDFNSLTDNSIYTAAVDSADSAIATIQDGDSLLSDMGDSLSKLMDMVNGAKDSIMRKISDALNFAIDKIMSIKLPKFITDILDSLKSLDLGGVKGFFKDLLRVGSMFLCNNLDFLKSFMLGYSLTDNILSGLLIGLLLSWLDRYCKGFTSAEMQAASLKGKLDMMFTDNGFTLTPDTAFGTFSNSYADYVRSNATYTPATPYPTTNIINNFIIGDISSSVSNIRSSELSTTEKKDLIAAIDTRLEDFEPGSDEYNNLLTGRGEVIKTPLISDERRDAANSYSNLNDALGNLAVSVKDIDVSKINSYDMTEVEKGLLEKLKEFKTSVEADADINTRPTSTGSFGDYDFSKILPQVTPEEEAYLSTLPGTEDSYKYNGLHPTTSVFLEKTMPGNTVVTPVQTVPTVGGDYVSVSGDKTTSGNKVYDPSNTNQVYVDSGVSSSYDPKYGAIDPATGLPFTGDKASTVVNPPVIPGCCHA